MTRTGSAWSGREFDLEGIDDLESIVDALRDLEPEGPALLLLEENDEWLAVVRVDGDADPRVFLSDRRAVESSEVAAMLWDVDAVPAPTDDDEGNPVVIEPVGDAALLADLGTPEEDLLKLCAHEGLLPADVLSAVGERAGFLDVLDELREV
jgi:putative tRNA adenosine deaminase-associated protein